MDVHLPASIRRETIGSRPQLKPSSLEFQRSSDATVRIASFHFDYLGVANADKAYLLDIVARVVRQFDVVALQGVSSSGSTIVPELADLVNQTGRKYDYILGAPAAIQHRGMQYAFLFDRQTIFADRTELYTLRDPHDLLHREPLVGWFRAKQAAIEEAFTFTIVNLHTELRRHEQELNVLDDVLFEVRNDGRGEDDVIMLGCFHADDRHLGELGNVSGIVAAIRSIPTNVDSTLQTENIVFQNPATDEFTGRAGVFDFLRAYNLTVERAREVSNYMPVWAEFSIFEGGERGRADAGSL